MNLEAVERVAVLGAGTLGHGIAEVAALAGFDVRMRDVSEEAVRAGYRDVEWSLEKLVEDGRVAADEAGDALDRLTPLVDLEAAVADADVVVEAVPEDRETKEHLYRELAGVAADRAVLATNTSALSVTDLAAATDRPERFCGMHFFNPPVSMDLVEVVAGERTDEATRELVVDLAEAMGKTPIRVADSPGFVVNRVLLPVINEAAWAVHAGETSVEAVDAAVVSEMGLPTGPLELADRIGLDVLAQVLDSLHRELGAAYRPCPLVVERVEAGRLGRKSGAGFYEYENESEGGGPAVGGDGDRDRNGDGGGDVNGGEASVVRRLRAVAANEVAKLLAADVADVETVDRALVLGAGFPAGPARAADRAGLGTLLETLAERHERTAAARYEPAGELERRVAAGVGFYDDAAVAADGGGDGDGTESENEDGRTVESTDGDGGERAFDALAVERRADGVGHVRLDRPERLNTISPALLEELAAAVEDLEADDAVRALAVTGAGDAFSAGADVRAVALDVEPMEAADLARRGQSVFGRLEACPMPVVAGVRGYCLGGGMELATACDLRIGGRGATFGQPEHDLGLLPGFGGTQRLARVIGEGRAKEVIFTAERYGAERMAEYGFLTEVVDAENVVDRTLALAAELAEGPPLAQALTKRAMRAGRDDVDAGLEVEAQAFGHLVGTADAEEGISAFLDDRDPEFEGE
jgi:enoyl-CoA hydratase/3-hydroxyacyl-CoA dehydrogenase